MQCFDQKAKDWFQKTYNYDPEKAKSLLEKAGWVDSDGDGIREKDGKKLEFTFLAFTDWTTIPEAMTNQLKEVGFDMSIERWNTTTSTTAATKITTIWVLQVWHGQNLF